MWNERFARPGYLFGTEPALFVREQAARLAPGSQVLSVAEGEGRNAVWLAGQGHRVTAFEQSPNALAKAHALAQERGVEVAFHEADIFEWDWQARDYDAVFGVFIQFVGPDERARIFDGLKTATRPGGRVFLHGYTPRQLEYGTGGPPHAQNMYTPELLEDAFGDWQIERLEAYDREIDEGAGHSGRSALIDLIARKPARKPA